MELQCLILSVDILNIRIAAIWLCLIEFGLCVCQTLLLLGALDDSVKAHLQQLVHAWGTASCWYWTYPPVLTGTIKFVY